MRRFAIKNRIYIERQVNEMQSSLRTDEEIEKIYKRHVDTVYRICYSFMKNAADAEDMVQETFLKLIVSVSMEGYLRKQANSVWEPYEITREDLEKIADTIDFSMIP